MVSLGDHLLEGITRVKSGAGVDRRLLAGGPTVADGQVHGEGDVELKGVLHGLDA